MFKYSIHQKSNILNNKTYQILYIFGLLTFFISCSKTVETTTSFWLKENNEAKPWTRWWWHGSAVTEDGITKELETLLKSGFGGVEITPIYGVIGEEDQFVEYLSPRWVALLQHTIAEAKRLGLGVDMATGTGWPFGGPMVDADHAANYLEYKHFVLKEGEHLTEALIFKGDGFVRSVKNQALQSYASAKEKETQNGYFHIHPDFSVEMKSLTLADIKKPISDNQNLQRLALDQVRFADTLELVDLMAYSDKGDAISLMKFVDKNHILNWTAPAGVWDIYAVFFGIHGKMVERAAPGGEGLVIDHFGESAIDHYLSEFENKLGETKGIRCFFNDSYEVDDAKGQANFSKTIFQEFDKRRGYKLSTQLHALFDTSNVDHTSVLCDYRETVSDMMLDNFTTHWDNWAANRQSNTRNQAHGSPANILDLYASCDIPETEGTDMMRIKFASSAGHVSGKHLISAEAVTWLNEHFLSNLADVKQNIDRYLVGGINHIFYHGTAYSPVQDKWPGRLFYAAVQVNDRNPLWRHWPALNTYFTRCQSYLQAGLPDNDVLVYYPFHDYISEPKGPLLRHVDGHGPQIDSTSFAILVNKLLDEGITCDFISDRQLAGLIIDSKGMIESNGVKYKAIMIPELENFPNTSLSTIFKLANQKAKIIFDKKLPSHDSGLKPENMKSQYQLALRDLQNTKGIIITQNPVETLKENGIIGEDLMNHGISFIRRKMDHQVIYFVTNMGDTLIDAEISLNAIPGHISAADPMSGEIGKLNSIQENNGKLKHRIQLFKGQSMILQATENEISDWDYIDKSAKIWALDQKWNIHFLEGGPQIPNDTTLSGVAAWTDFEGEKYQSFSGTAIYKTSFTKMPDWPDQLILDLGKVHETAKITINGLQMGTLIGPNYHLVLDTKLLKASNLLEIEVTNLMANHITYLDKNGLFWKRFYNVNFPSKLAENRNQFGLFDASNWGTLPSGIEGPIVLISNK